MMTNPRLFHFTALGHLPAIARTGFLKVTESNASRLRLDAAPRVVWLTTARAAKRSHGLDVRENRRTAADKTRVRFEVDAPNAEPWLGSDLYKAMEPAWRRQLIVAGGGMAAARTWWIAPERIERSQWLAVEIDRARILHRESAGSLSPFDQLAQMLGARPAA